MGHERGAALVGEAGGHGQRYRECWHSRWPCHVRNGETALSLFPPPNLLGVVMWCAWRGLCGTASKFASLRAAAPRVPCCNGGVLTQRLPWLPLRVPVPAGIVAYVSLHQPPRRGDGVGGHPTQGRWTVRGDVTGATVVSRSHSSCAAGWSYTVSGQICQATPSS